jgi:hypothetical protein
VVETVGASIGGILVALLIIYLIYKALQNSTERMRKELKADELNKFNK